MITEEMKAWLARFKDMNLLEEEEKELVELVNKVLERTKPQNPFEYAFLSEKFANISGYVIYNDEAAKKMNFIVKSLEEQDGQGSD